MTPTTSRRSSAQSDGTSVAGAGAARGTAAEAAPTRRPRPRTRATASSQASALGPIGMPIYYPKLIVAGLAATASRAPPTATTRSRSGSEYHGSYPRAYLIHDRHGVAHYRLPR